LIIFLSALKQTKDEKRFFGLPQISGNYFIHIDRTIQKLWGRRRFAEPALDAVLTALKVIVRSFGDSGPRIARRQKKGLDGRFFPYSKL